MLTMLESHLRKRGAVKIMERSIHSGRYVFVENLYRSKQMEKVEYAILDDWYRLLDEKSGFILDADLTSKWIEKFHS